MHARIQQEPVLNCTKLTYTCISIPVALGTLESNERIAAFINGTHYNKYGDVDCHHINPTTWDFLDEIHGKMHGTENILFSLQRMVAMRIDLRSSTMYIYVHVHV